MTKKPPYGYVAPRPNFMSIREQIEELTAHGVHSANILTNEDGVDVAIGWCDPDTDLIVYSSTVFGTVREYDRILGGMTKQKASLIVIRADDLRIDAKGTEAYRKGKKDLNLRNALIGSTHGRKKTVTRAVADKIIHFCRVQGNSQLSAADKYNASTTQVSKIMNDEYFAYEGKE
ncbi:MAG: hypothetical protein ACUZ8E_12005 [Candidatus Anammoxibacter sp.]